MVTQPFLDIVILDTHNEETLLVGDASRYPAGYIISSPSLAIKVPGYPEKILPFDPGNMMVLSSTSLELVCGSDCPFPLPDGLYRVKYSIAPSHTYSIEKFFLRTVALERRYDGLFLYVQTLSGPAREKARTILDSIDDYLQGAVSAANRCAQKEAVDFYTKALHLLDTLQKTC